MYQLTYRSKATPNLKTEDLNQILNEATDMNGIKNITGCLIHYNESFIQILEGKENDVLDIFEKIKQDARHYAVELLWENQYEGRSFSDWNMAFYQPNGNTHKEYLNNLLLLSQFSERASGTLLSFWGSVSKILNDDPQSSPEPIL